MYTGQIHNTIVGVEGSILAGKSNSETNQGTHRVCKLNVGTYAAQKHRV